MAQSKYNHRKYYSEGKYRKTLSKFDIRSGMIVTFPYAAFDKRPLVFVMDTDEFLKPELKSFSGINLNYLPIKEINDFFIKSLTKVSWVLDIKTRYPRAKLWDEEVAGVKPIALYKTLVKKVLRKRNCWRTYKYSKVRFVEQVIFKFEDPPLNQIWQDGFEKISKISESTMHRKLKDNKTQKNITFKTPNFRMEWDKMVIHSEFEEMGKSTGIKYSKSNAKIYKFSQIKNLLKNINLNYDKIIKNERAKFETSFEKGKIEMPVVAKFGNNDYKLIFGETTLAGCFSRNIDSKIWLIDLKSHNDMKESEHISISKKTIISKIKKDEDKL